MVAVNVLQSTGGREFKLILQNASRLLRLPERFLKRIWAELSGIRDESKGSR